MSEDPERKPDFWARPVFSVANMQASIDYYREKLGFELRWRAEDDAAEVHRNATKLILHRGNTLPSSRVFGVCYTIAASSTSSTQTSRSAAPTLRAAPFQLR